MVFHTRVFEKIIDDISMLVDDKVKHVKRDMTFKSRVMEKVSDGKYKVLYRNKLHTARGASSTNVGDWVYVCVPGNDWNELFVVYNISGAK